MTPKLRRYASQLVTFGLLSFVAYQSAQLFWHLMTPTAAVVVPTIEQQPAKPLLSQLKLQAQTAPSKKSTSTQPAVPAALANWQLKGTYLEDNNDPIAIIQTPQGSRVAEIGEIIKDNVTLAAIYENHVVLDNQGQPVELYLKRGNLNTISNSSAGAVTVKQNGQVAQSANSNALSALSPQLLLQHLSLTAEAYGQRTAYRVTVRDNDAQGAAILKQLGLQSGDLVIALNGLPPTPQSAHELIVSAQKSQKISAKIKRNDKIHTIILNY